MTSEPRVLPHTSRARVSLAIARSVAAARGDTDVTPVHVAIGLLREGGNAAVAALMHAGVNVYALRAELEIALGPPGRPGPDVVALGLTTGEERLTDAARRISRERADPYLGPEHLLLAVLADEATSARRMLAGHGIDSTNARTHVDSIFVEHGDTHAGPRP